MEVTPAELALERQMEITLLPFYERLYALPGTTREELEQAAEEDATLDLMAAALLLFLVQGVKIGADLGHTFADYPMLAKGLPTDTPRAERWARRLTAIKGADSLIATVISEILAGRDKVDDVAAWARQKALSKVRSVARTEISRAVEWGTNLIYKMFRVDEVEFVVREGACKICAPLAGIYKREEAPFIPQHTNCRCIKRPALRGESDDT